jgi:YfiH family protein
MTHGFFTRHGGCSEGIYDSLQCAYSTKDDIRSNVAHNRSIAAQALGVSSESLVFGKQDHTDTVLQVEKYGQDLQNTVGDSLVTQLSGVALCVLTADCAPVLLEDSKAGIVAAVHSGWKGALRGVLAKTVDMICALGGTRENIVAALGPCIGKKSYETGPEFIEQFIAQDKSNRQFFISSARENHYMFDMQGYIVRQLKNCGAMQISCLEMDTYSDEDFFSNRRSFIHKKTDYGRLVSIIVNKKNQ